MSFSPSSSTTTALTLRRRQEDFPSGIRRTKSHKNAFKWIKAGERIKTEAHTHVHTGKEVAVNLVASQANKQTNQQQQLTYKKKEKKQQSPVSLSHHGWPAGANPPLRRQSIPSEVKSGFDRRPRLLTAAFPALSVPFFPLSSPAWQDRSHAPFAFSLP